MITGILPDRFDLNSGQLVKLLVDRGGDIATKDREDRTASTEKTFEQHRKSWNFEMELIFY